MADTAPVREWNSESYHRVSDLQFGWGLKVLDRVSVQGHETVLDAGCGTARITAMLAQRLPHGRVVAMDLSENMLRTARQALSKEAGAEIGLVCADLVGLPFRRCFDGVFSTAAFHWVHDHDRLFRELFAVLKPGGWLEAQCGGGPNIARLRQCAGKLIAREPYCRYFVGWRDPWEFSDPETAEHRLKAAGFTNVQTSLEAANSAFHTAEEFRQFSSTVTLHHHLARIPDADLRERFLDEITGMFQRDGSFELDYWRLNLSARKPGR